MTALLLTLLCLGDPGSESIWQLRAGLSVPLHSSVQGGAAYLAVFNTETDMSYEEMLQTLAGGNSSISVPLAALHVSRGNLHLARLYWSNPYDPPATRADLLAALSWYGRFELYAVMASNPAVPSDMEGKLHSDQCAAICSLGWMNTRQDGLFHGEEIVTASDITTLSRYFQDLNISDGYLTLQSLDSLFTGRSL